MLALLAAAGLLAVPPSDAALIRTHLDAIETAGWAKVVPPDLYHGHVVLRPGAPDRYRSVHELFANAAFLLYHADEQLTRWRLADGDLPSARKRPRSIVGYRNGAVVPAASLMRDPSVAPYYEWGGTINTDALARELPGQAASRRDVRVRDGDSWCLVNLQFDFAWTEGRLQMTTDCMTRERLP